MKEVINFCLIFKSLNHFISFSPYNDTLFYILLVVL